MRDFARKNIRVAILGEKMFFIVIIKVQVQQQMIVIAAAMPYMLIVNAVAMPFLVSLLQQCH